MATSRIMIENGRIACYDSRYVEWVSDDRRQFVGNGWHLCIDAEAGIIHCWSMRLYKPGWTVYEKTYKLADGLIGLSGGDVRQRYTYFRSAELQRFLYEHDVTTIQRGDPNGEYYLQNCRTASGVIRNSIRTDGVVEELDHDSLRTDKWREECPMTCAWESVDKVRVAGATWAIFDVYEDCGSRHSSESILKTLKNVLQIRNIKNEEKRRKWHQMVHQVVGPLATATEEEVMRALQECHCKTEPTKYAANYWRRMEDGAILKMNSSYDDCDYAVIKIMSKGGWSDDVLRVYPEDENAFMD